MATHKKDEPEKPKPASAVVYLPNTDSEHKATHYTVSYVEGEKGVKSINWVSPQMLTLRMEDGQIITFANIPFQYNSYPQPPAKKEARL